MRVLLLVFLLGLAAPAGAVVVLDANGCGALALWSHDLVWARDVGADKAKVRASLVEYRETTEHPVFALLLQELDKLWSTRLKREAVMEAVVRDCVRRRGAYGDET